MLRLWWLKTERRSLNWKAQVYKSQSVSNASGLHTFVCSWLVDTTCLSVYVYVYVYVFVYVYMYVYDNKNMFCQAQFHLSTFELHDHQPWLIVIHVLSSLYPALSTLSLFYIWELRAQSIGETDSAVAKPSSPFYEILPSFIQKKKS